MLAARALDALERAEARELAEHLAACDECGAELEAWRATVAALAYAAPAREPAADLRSRILKSVRAEAVGEKRTAKVVLLAKRQRARWSTGMKVGALAASIALIAMAAALVIVWNRYNSLRQDFAQMSGRWELAQGELKREREELARRQEALELMTSPGAQVTALAGTDLATRAHGKFVYDRNTGRAEMHEQLPVEARAASVFAVTLEPSGGVAAPTGAKYLLGSTS